MMSWSGLVLTSVTYASTIRTPDLHRANIILVVVTLIPDRGMSPKGFSGKLRQKPDRVPITLKKTAPADQVFCATPLN